MRISRSGQDLSKHPLPQKEYSMWDDMDASGLEIKINRNFILNAYKTSDTKAINIIEEMIADVDISNLSAEELIEFEKAKELLTTIADNILIKNIVE